MYTSYNSSLEKNQMLTPPTIGLTSSIVNDKLSNIVLEDNSSSSGLFTTNEDKTAIQTKDGIPLEASQFRITGTNDEIDSNENNAVNKRYLSNKIGNLDDKYMKKDVKSLNLNSLTVSDGTTQFDFKTFGVNGKTYLRILQNNSQFVYFNKDLISFPTKIGINNTYGIQFNSNEQGNKNSIYFPQGVLKNLVPSTTTSDELTNYTKYNYLDNVCPTYQFTENTYAKKSEVSTNLAWNSFSVYTTDGDDFKKQLSNISLKIAGSHITIPIPTDINSTNLIMSVDFTVRSTNKTALNALGCTLNSLSGSSTLLSETDTRASVFSGYTTKGTCIRTNSPYEYKFSLICPFSTTRHKKAYLHFFFDDSVNYTANDEIYILATKTEPQVNVTIFGI